MLTWTRLLTITNFLRSRPVLFSTPEQFLIPPDISDRQNGCGIPACRRRFAFWAASRPCSGMERIFGTETIRSSQELPPSGLHQAPSPAQHRAIIPPMDFFSFLLI